MIVSNIEEITIYESPDGGKTVYARKSGETCRVLHSIDPTYKKEQEALARWTNLKKIVMTAPDDPALNDLLEKIEIYYELKYK
jgi:hypothetical protein